MVHDLAYTWRTLRQRPGFACAVVLTLALGIGATTLIFSVVHAVLLRPLPFPEPERLVVLWQRNTRKGLERERVSPANFADWSAGNRVFESIGFYPAWGGAQSFRLVGSDGPERVP